MHQNTLECVKINCNNSALCMALQEIWFQTMIIFQISPILWKYSASKYTADHCAHDKLYTSVLYITAVHDSRPHPHWMAKLTNTNTDEKNRVCLVAWLEVTGSGRSPSSPSPSREIDCQISKCLCYNLRAPQKGLKNGHHRHFQCNYQYNCSHLLK